MPYIIPIPSCSFPSLLNYHSSPDRRDTQPPYTHRLSTTSTQSHDDIQNGINNYHQNGLTNLPTRLRRLHGHNPRHPAPMLGGLHGKKRNFRRSNGPSTTPTSAFGKLPPKNNTHLNYKPHARIAVFEELGPGPKNNIRLVRKPTTTFRPEDRNGQSKPKMALLRAQAKKEKKELQNSTYVEGDLFRRYNGRGKWGGKHSFGTGNSLDL